MSSSSSASLAAVQKKRSGIFQQRFGLPPSEELIADFLCALQQKILLQGRLYVSQHYVAFYAKVFGQETKLVIPASDITGVTLAKSLGIVPNAIKLYTTYNQYWLGSFVKRQAAFDLLNKVSRGERLGQQDVVMEPSQRSNASHDEDHNELSQQHAPHSDDDDPPHRHPHDDDDDGPHLPPKKRKAKPPPKAKPKPRPTEEQQEDEDASPLPPPDDDEAVGRRKKQVNGRSPVKANGRTPVKKAAAPPPPPPPEEEEEEGEEPPSPRSLSESKEAGTRGGGGGEDSDGFNEDDEIIQKLKAAARRKPAGAVTAVGVVGGASRKQPRDHSDIYLYPPLTTGADARVQQLHLQIRKQRGLSIGVEGRRFLFEGFLQRQGRWSVVDRWCFLFSDAFVFCKQTDNERWEMKQFMPLHGLVVDTRPASMQPTMRKTKLPHPFRLIYSPPPPSAPSVADSIPSSLPPITSTPPPTAPPAEYTVSTDTREHRDAWVQRLLLAIAAFTFNTDRSYRPFGWYYHFWLGGVHQAVWDGDVTLLQALVKENENLVDSDDMEGRTPLHVCAEKNDATLIPLLLDLGATPTRKDRDGLTPLHIAARQGNLTTLNALLTSKAVDFAVLHNGDRSPRHFRDTSALWLCALNAQVEWMECFGVILSLSRAAQRRQIMDDRDDDGQTLLEAVCAANLIRVMPTLIKHGASIDLPNRAGMTPLSVATRKGNKELATALIAQGAQPNLRFIPSLSAPLHHATSVDMASFLCSVGGRTALKNAKGVRVLDLFPSPASHAALERGEELHAARPAVDTDDPMHPQASTNAQNGGHPLESCVLCKDDFSIVKKRDYCRRCGLNVCQQDSSKKLIFRRVRDRKKERVLARVCDGCYNVVMFRLREDGGVGMQAPASYRVKKKGRGWGWWREGGRRGGGEEREVSRRAAPSKSKKWEEVDPEEEEGGEGGGGGGEGGVDGATPGHSRATSEGDESPVEDGLTGAIKGGLKKGLKGAIKVGGFLGGRLGRVFDDVTDGLTNMAVPKGAQRRGGAVNDLGGEGGVGRGGGRGRGGWGGGGGGRGGGGGGGEANAGQEGAEEDDHHHGDGDGGAGGAGGQCKEGGGGKGECEGGGCECCGCEESQCGCRESGADGGDG